MDFIILKVNGEDVRNCSHKEAMEVFQRTPDPIIVIEVMRRSQPSTGTTPPAVSHTPTVGGGGGLCSGGGGQAKACDSISEISSLVSTRCTAGSKGVDGIDGSTRSVAVQTVLSAGELAASLAIAATSFAQQEARMALLGESIPYCIPGKNPADYLFRMSCAEDRVDDDDDLDDEDDKEDGDAEDVDDAVFGVNEVGHLDYILKRYPCNANGILSPFYHPHAFAQPVDSVYSNFPENPASSSCVSGSLPAGDYASNNSEKCFEVILQKQSVSDKFGLTLCYRSSEVRQNLTEVYVNEIGQGSVAQRSGQIMPGDQIVKIGDEEITSREHVIDLFRASGLCAKVTLIRHQPPWKQPSDRLPSSYPVIPYPDSTLDIGISSASYAHLPDQDSGMGRTTDDSVRTEESSEQEVEEHKVLLMNAWSLFDPTAGRNSSSDPPLPSAIASTATRLAQTSPGNTHRLDDELIHLSQLMQSLAMHCHKLAYVKMCGGLQVKETSAATDAVAASEAETVAVDVAESGVGAAPVSEGSGSGDRARKVENAPCTKTRQKPRMGLGAASTSHKSSSANGIAKPKASAFYEGDYYEAVLMPKQPGNPLTLSLSHRQPPTTHLSAPFDLDTTLSQAKGHDSMPPTNPSSVWSIAETDKETVPSKRLTRFTEEMQFMHRGSRSSHVGSTSSCERPESSNSLKDIASAKPPVQPSTGTGNKISFVSSNSTAFSSIAAVTTTAATTTNSQLVVGIGGTCEGLGTIPAVYSPGLSLPQAFLHHHPYEFYNRYFKCGLQSPSPPPPLTPHFLTFSPVAAGIIPDVRYPSPPRPHPNELGGNVTCKDEAASYNIYETPYAAVDVVNTNGANDCDGNVCFTSYGVINATYGSGNGDGNHNRRYAAPGESQTRSRPLMEWVVKKRTDGTRYITRRPIRNRFPKDRPSHRHTEEHAGGTTDDDGGVDEEARSRGDGRHCSKGSGYERRQEQQERSVGLNSARRVSNRASRAPSGHRRRGTPTRQPQQSQSQQQQPPTSNGGLISLTTV